MERVSEYWLSLPADTRERYQCRVSSTGLRFDPYAIEFGEWTETPEIIPAEQWSDIMLYMVCTPSPYTREEIKVNFYH